MPAPLLNPDNKLLSWSITDIGLYGAAITPATMAAAQDHRAEATRGDTQSVQDNAAGEASTIVAPPVDAVAPADSPTVGPSDTGTGAFTPAALQPSSLQLDTLQAPSIVAPPQALDVGGGSGGVFVPAPMPPPSALTMPATAADSGAQTLSAPTLAIGTAAIEPALAVLPIQPVTDALFTTATATLDQATDVLEQTVGLVADTAAGAGETLSDTVGAATAALDTTLDSVTPQVAAVVDTLADATTTVTSGLGDTLDTTTTAATDLLTGIGGTDPAGGVSTLVDMVAAADEYDLTQIATAPIADTGSIVDLLAVDTADLPLLGDGDGLDHHDDGPIGLFGL